MTNRERQNRYLVPDGDPSFNRVQHMLDGSIWPARDTGYRHVKEPQKQSTRRIHVIDRIA